MIAMWGYARAFSVLTFVAGGRALASAHGVSTANEKRAAIAAHSHNHFEKYRRVFHLRLPHSAGADVGL